MFYICPFENSGVSGVLSRLVLGSLTIADEGEYKCRVDYSQAPTKIDSVTLSILGEHTVVRLQLGAWSLKQLNEIQVQIPEVALIIVCVS